MPLHKHSHGARSVPHKRPYLLSIFWVFLHYLSLIASATLGFVFLTDKESGVGHWLVGALISVGATWLATVLARRAARCPLCSGTPLFDSRAAKHRKAFRIKPLNYGMTAQLSLLFLQRFRCMYCGTPFDLHRPRAMQDHKSGR